MRRAFSQGFAVVRMRWAYDDKLVVILGGDKIKKAGRREWPCIEEAEWCI